MAQPLPPHLTQQHPINIANPQPPQPPSGAHTHPSSSASKAPYGAGDTEDGYTLVFPSLDAFYAWRAHEEETQVVEFVKGDTHGSKAVPPRFKDHTKLVCARHSRSGRKKYVKKHPERVRKVPSRKLEGQGCPASISFKTYFDTEEVRACYVNQHSHEIGPANFPFTRRGRKAVADNEKGTKRPRADGGSSTPPPPSAGPSSVAPSHPPAYAPMMAAPPQAYPPPSQHFVNPQQPPNSLAVSQDRWDRMAVLFSSIRENARAFEYPGPSVVALESVLIRLYLETPVGQSAQQPPGMQPQAMQNQNPGGSASAHGLNGNGMASNAEGS
ncbi:hypothetical protein PLICRDRAFT_101062 [Plicaturopsis crispa FD-325 SS-3]|nr:hypothetical protein PLICRDRAFT_101062 [Plicaturopsis crispa FD-325 SS-3]